MAELIERVDDLPDVPEELRAANIDVTEDEIEEYIKGLDSLCLLEASQLKREIDNNLRQWQMCKQALDEIAEKKPDDDDLNKEVLRSNILQSVNVDSPDTFNAEYERNVGYLTKISDKLLQIIDKDRDKVDSTVFMTNEMLTIMKKRRDSLKPEMLNYQRELKTADMIISTFEDRLIGGYDNRHFLFERFQSYLAAHRKELSKSFRSEAKTVLYNQKTRAIKDLCTQFSETTVAKFMDRLRDAFDDDSGLILAFTSFLVKQLDNGKKNGTDSQAKLLILDLVDIYNGIYDVPNVDENDYLDDLWETCGAYGRMYLSTEKLQLKVGRTVVTGSTFGLVLPRFMNQSDIPDEIAPKDIEVPGETGDIQEEEGPDTSLWPCDNRDPNEIDNDLATYGNVESVEFAEEHSENLYILGGVDVVPGWQDKLDPSLRNTPEE